MKLTLRPEWRLWPLASFLGMLDLKTGVTVALLFALLNKVAGVYGLIAVLAGAGGSFAQLSLYLYSVLALVALAWGLRTVKEEDPKHTLYFAHLFFADHILSTAWTAFFAVVWWIYTPHDGQRSVNSKAQEEILKGAEGSNKNMTDSERIEAANMLWNKEKGTAGAVIIISWLAKFYFALLIYSYASHLRKGSYRNLPHTRNIPTVTPAAYENSALQDDDEEIGDFYHVPLRTPQSGSGNGAGPRGSASSFADFVSAPGRPRRSKSAKDPSLNKISNAVNGRAGGSQIGEGGMVFDEDEMARQEELSDKSGVKDEERALVNEGRSRI